MNKTAIGSVSFVSALLAAAPTYAQQAGKQQIEEIVVTAQKRQERLQDVPIAIHAMGGAAMKALSVTSTADLGEVTPGLFINRVSSAAIITLRGIGNQNAAVLGDEGATVLYVDGVYIPGSQGLVFEFNNIQHIEVEKGPQGTLFGRNATGGVVQIFTKTPSQTPHADFDIGYGNYDTLTSNFYGTAGITSNLAADLAVHVNEQNDGWGKNLINGGNEFTDHSYAARTKWLLSLENTKVTFSADFSHSMDNSGTAYSMFPGSKSGDPALPAGPVGGFYDVDLNFPSVSMNTSYGGSLTIDHDLDWAHLVSITAGRDVQSNNLLDQDGTPEAISDASLFEREHTLTQEVQLVSPAESKLKWLTGFYYYRDRSGYQPLALEGSSAPPGGLQIESHQDTESFAGFGQATATVLPKTDLTVGLRYTLDQRHVEGEIVDPLFPFPPNPLVSGNQSAQFEKTTYRFALDYHFSPDILGYVSYNRGFKSGVFNVISPETAAVRPEVLDAYEAGVHTELFDRRLRLNGAAFYYQFSDLQLLKIVNGSSSTVNAGAADVEGLDFDIDARPLEHLSVIAGFSYLDSFFTSYPNAPYNYPDPAGGNFSNITGNAEGNALPFAPKVSFNIGGTYMIPTANGNFTGAINYARTGSTYVNADNLVKVPEFGLLNASLTWNSPNDRYDVRLWGKNLTNTHYYAYVTEQGGGNTASPAAPLTFGITLGVHL